MLCYLRVWRPPIAPVRVWPGSCPLLWRWTRKRIRRPKQESRNSWARSIKQHDDAIAGLLQEGIVWELLHGGFVLELLHERSFWNPYVVSQVEGVTGARVSGWKVEG